MVSIKRGSLAIALGSVKEFWNVDRVVAEIRNPDSFRPHPRESEILDESVRYTFEDENEYDDEDEKKNEDRSGADS